MIRVLIVEDSPTVHQMLVRLLSAAPEIEIIGWAQDGEEGVRQAHRLRPDLITMDIQMPRMDGFEASRRIMEEVPTPILVISANVDDKEMNVAFNALKAGALEAIAKPRADDPRSIKELGGQLVRLVKTLAGVKVVRRYNPRRAPGPTLSPTTLTTFAPEVHSPPVAADMDARLVAIGASTGGPQVLEHILRLLPADYPHPVVVVQHMTPGFLGGLVNWLDQVCPLPVSLIRSGETVGRGVFFAPDGHHVQLDGQHRLLLSTAEPVGGHRPSVDVLFESVARHYGPKGVGVLLTGMGADGALGMEKLYNAGGLTIAQDETTSTVFGMPREAIKRLAARWIMPLGALAEALAGLPKGALELPRSPAGK